MSAGARLYTRLTPLEDDGGDGTLEALTTAWMAPVEIAEISRDYDATTDEKDTDQIAVDEFDYDDGPLPAPWTEWLGALPEIVDGAAVPDGYGDATHTDVLTENSFVELLFRDPYDPSLNIGVGVKDGYSFELNSNGNARMWGGPAFHSLVYTPIPTGSIEGIRIVSREGTIYGWCLADDVWVLALQIAHREFSNAGNPGFWVDGTAATPIESISWGPLATIPLVAWEALWDPDGCPEDLLDWLAVANGIVLPPSALTAADKRYRIKQAAGRYRGTPRALVEEVQLELTGVKTVYMAFQANGERWRYAVGTVDSETPDTAAVEAAIERQNPAFTLWDRILTSDWSYLVLGPTLVATRVGGEYTISEPTYPDYASIVAAFSDYQHLEDNDPDL